MSLILHETQPSISLKRVLCAYDAGSMPDLLFTVSEHSLIDRIGKRGASMAKAKAEAIEMIKQLPDDVATSAIMEELFFKQQVEKGLQDVAEGRVLTHQELKERMAQRRKSVGR